MYTERSLVIRSDSERGVALIMTLLIMMLMTALLVGFTAVVMGDQRYQFIDRDRVRAFYGANSGIEKLNADLANLFFVNVAPSAAQIATLSDNAPEVPGVTFTTSGEGTPYGVTFLGSSSGQITTGPYQGLIALKQTYELGASARTASGGEAHLRRTVETVAIPVFQFGMFSEVDLSFSAADEFDFGGRVHTNGNLFLAQGGAAGSTLWLRDRVTAVGEVVRQRLSNGESIDASGSIRTVKMARAPNSFRDLERTEGSVADGVGSAESGTWPTLSLSTYNSYIRNGRTGARPLNLPLITTGGANADMVRRPIENEHVSNPVLLGERFFSQVSLRILLSDTPDDITKLPTVTAAAPVSLDDVALAPIARSLGPVPVSVTLFAAVAAGADREIRLNATVPAFFKAPALRVKKGATTYNINCTGKTGHTFTGCTPTNASAVNTPATIEATVNTVDGAVTVSTPLTANWASGSGTITVGTSSTSVFNTAAFAPHTFWVHNGNGTTVLVTCRGYNNSDRLTLCNVPAALQNGAAVTTAALSSAGTPLLGGFIKIEMQDDDNVWHDVTMEILEHGISGPNLNTGQVNPFGRSCADPTPNAILRLQRLRDNAEPGNIACTYENSQISSDYWPNVLFDAREAVSRDVSPGTDLRLSGVMHYVALDARNLSRWFQGIGVYAGGSGPDARFVNGYAVYFSDRRNNRNLLNEETGEFGFEDLVNPDTSGVPNGVLDPGENMNGNGTLETYGQFPSYEGQSQTVPPGAVAPLDANARPTTGIRSSHARVNRAILFRRALKLVNGGLGNIVAPGFTVAAENPIYVQGNWNAASPGFSDNDGHVATAAIGDVVTLLSNNWNDNSAMDSPYAVTGRPRSANTYYRLAIISGKGPIFPKPADAASATYGTDGGAHSFLRMLEGNSTSGANTIHYRGSMATFFFNRQAVSPFKCCGGVVYAVPARAFAFDIDFLDPAKLPPLTPVFRDFNALGFTQEIRPGR